MNRSSDKQGTNGLLDWVFNVYHRARLCPVGSMDRYVAVGELLCCTGLYNVLPIERLLSIKTRRKSEPSAEIAEYTSSPASIIDTTPFSLSADEDTAQVGLFLDEIGDGEYGDFVKKNVGNIYFVWGLIDPVSGMAVSASNEPLTQTVFINTKIVENDQCFKRDPTSMAFDLILQAGYLHAYHQYPEDFSRGLISKKNSTALPDRLIPYLDDVCSSIKSPTNMQYMKLETLDKPVRDGAVTLLKQSQKTFTDRNARIRANDFFKLLQKRLKNRQHERMRTYLTESTAINDAILHDHNHFIGLPPNDYQPYESIECLGTNRSKKPYHIRPACFL